MKAEQSNTPKSGSLLLSEPFMPDPNFKRTVIFLCEHNDEGSFGLVLNRQAGVKLDQIIDGVDGFDADLYIGGPVQNDTLHYLHTIGDMVEGSREVVPGLYWGGNFEMIKLLIEGQGLSQDEIRFFLGYSGWSPGQLQEEMEENSWIVHPAKAKHVFEANPDDLWKEVLQEKGGDYAMMVNFPEDPRLN